MGRRLTAAMCTALALSSFMVPASSARPGTTCWPDSVRVWRIRSASRDAKSLDATLRFRALGTRSTLVVVAARQRSGRWDQPVAHMWFEPPPATDGYPHAYGGTMAPVATPERPSAVPEACDRPGAYFERPILKRSDARTYDWFVAALNTDVTITVTSPGWVVTPVAANTGAALRVYRNHDGTGAGADVVRRVEHFTGVTADGGRYGSFAHAHLPCEPDHLTSEATGWGAATLLGGTSDHAVNSVGDRFMRCAGYDFDAIASSSGPTRWTVHGEAVGHTVIRNRLTVFDFPKPDRGK